MEGENSEDNDILRIKLYQLTYDQLKEVKSFSTCMVISGRDECVNKAYQRFLLLPI